MLFIKKDKVEEDVKKIREYTLTSEQLQKELKEEAAFEKKRKEFSEEFTWKDILAMTIAIIQVILPYFLVMIATMVAIFFFFIYMANH